MLKSVEFGLCFAIETDSDYFYCDCAIRMHLTENKYQVQIPAGILDQDNPVAVTLVVVCMVTLEVPTNFYWNWESRPCDQMDIRCYTEDKIEEIILLIYSLVLSLQLNQRELAHIFDMI